MRWVAKNVVAAGLAGRCEVQVAYAIGVAKPMGVYVQTFGTGKVDDEKLAAYVIDHFDMRPRALIEELDLLRPIYQPTSSYGHFGRSEFSWESTARAAELADALLGVKLKGAKKAHTNGSARTNGSNGANSSKKPATQKRPAPRADRVRA
jgi:S-adenosylmethionine synthetase